MADMFPPTLDEQINCVEREIRLRQNAYPRWIEKGRMKQDKADREIETMKAVSESLHRLKGLEK